MHLPDSEPLSVPESYPGKMYWTSDKKIDISWIVSMKKLGADYYSSMKKLKKGTI